MGNRNEGTNEREPAHESVCLVIIYYTVPSRSILFSIRDCSVPNKLIQRHRKEEGEGGIKGVKEKRKDILYLTYHTLPEITLKVKC